MANQLSDEEKAKLIREFKDVTGVKDDSRARFYLESAGWSLDVAAGSFYEEGNIDAVEEMSDEPESAAIPQQNSSASTAAASKPKPSSGSSSRFATIGSLARDSGSDSDDETGETYYAGGSERGAGQQVIGPPRKGAKSNSKLIAGVFNAAKERGAETVESLDPPGGAHSGTAAFQGAAYRLGDTSAPSEMITNSSAAASSPAQQVDVRLYMWRNGFSVDDGPLRDFQSPEGSEFMKAIMQGEVPRELIRAARGAEVSLNMVDKRTEDYVPPKKTVKSFSGEGHRLGSPTDAVTVPAASAASADEAAKHQKSAESAISIDSSAPTTSIQIRLTDGSRLVAKFNQSHTVSDVRTYIVTHYSARPEYGGVQFVLMTTFPNKEISDESQSLSAAGLLNAVLVVKPSK